jgi:predicted flavoprotein YhiN
VTLGASRRFGVLRAFPVSDTIAFFRDIGVNLHEKVSGKLPDSNRARDVLAARARGAVGVKLLPDIVMKWSG